MNAFRNIAAFIDGTDCDFGKQARRKWSNVTRLYKMCEQLRLTGAAQQVAQYFDGVGARKYESLVLDKIFGKELSGRVSEAYGWIKKEVANARRDKVEPRIYLFGFSRGAFGVRWLASLLDRCGVPADNENKIDFINAFANGDQKAISQLREEGRSESVAVWMLGVFDTVKARPGSEYGVRCLPGNVRFACHAMAIDEWRVNFDVLAFDDGQRPVIDQKWFAGGHSDIGGGYGDPLAIDAETRAERLASDVALDWMVGHARAKGLIFTSSFRPFSFDKNLKPVFHDARTWYYKLCNVLVKLTARFLRVIPDAAVVDDTVPFWQRKFGLTHDNYNETANPKSTRLAFFG